MKVGVLRIDRVPAEIMWGCGCVSTFVEITKDSLGHKVFSQADNAQRNDNQEAPLMKTNLLIERNSGQRRIATDQCQLLSG